MGDPIAMGAPLWASLFSGKAHASRPPVPAPAPAATPPAPDPAAGFNSSILAALQRAGAATGPGSLQGYSGLQNMLNYYRQPGALGQAPPRLFPSASANSNGNGNASGSTGNLNLY